MKKIILAVLTAIASSIMVGIGVVSAHVPSSSVSCDRISVKAAQYTEGAEINILITVLSTGKDRLFTFTVTPGSQFDTYNLPNPSPTEAFRWKITVTAPDWETYEVKGTQKACQPPASTVPPTTTPETTIPATTVPETTIPATTIPEVTVPEDSVPTCQGICGPADEIPPVVGEEPTCLMFDRGDGSWGYQWSDTMLDCSPVKVEEPTPVQQPEVKQDTPAVVKDAVTTTTFNPEGAMLPATGVDTEDITVWAAGFLFVGLTLAVLIARRKVQKPTSSK